MICAVVGPSGAGKDTLIVDAVRSRPDLHLVRRVITWAKGAGVEDFAGVSDAEFDTSLAAGEFALHWPAHGLRYALPWHRVQRGQGDVIFNGSRAALGVVRVLFAYVRVILVTSPPAILAQRLEALGREGQSDVAQRLLRAQFDLPDGIVADPIVVNDRSEQAGLQALLAALYPAAPYPAASPGKGAR
jgi:ribose 1,5-bisphosphokinase